MKLAALVALLLSCGGADESAPRPSGIHFEREYLERVPVGRDVCSIIEAAPDAGAQP